MKAKTKKGYKATVKLCCSECDLSIYKNTFLITTCEHHQPAVILLKKLSDIKTETIVLENAINSPWVKILNEEFVKK